MTGQLSALAQGKAAGYTSKLLKTGATTQYDSELDDGYYEVGVAKSYTINTTGAQSGTSNVDLAHYAGGAGAIAFNNSTKKITDSGNGLAIFKTNDVILTDSAANPGPFTVTTGNVAGEITCTGATFTDETPAGAVTLYKREAHSNNTVLDNNTGLEWMRTRCAKLGIASDGFLYVRGALHSVYNWVTAVNAASVGGHNDWRLPNMFELISLMDAEATTGAPDSTAFPSIVANSNWISSTRAANAVTTHQQIINWTSPSVTPTAWGTNRYYAMLVRGGTA